MRTAHRRTVLELVIRGVRNQRGNERAAGMKIAFRRRTKTQFRSLGEGQGLRLPRLCLLGACLLGLWLLGLWLLGVRGSGELAAQERGGFYDPLRLEALLQLGRESGLDEAQLRKLTIVDGGRTIAVWEYLQQQKAQGRGRQTRHDRWRGRTYRLPQDVFAALRDEEAADLRQLRAAPFSLEAGAQAGTKPSRGSPASDQRQSAALRPPASLQQPSSSSPATER